MSYIVCVCLFICLCLYCFKGMGYLHAKGILHKDMKSKNVFYDNGKVVITDFGLFTISGVLQAGRCVATVVLNLFIFWVQLRSPSEKWFFVWRDFLVKKKGYIETKNKTSALNHTASVSNPYCCDSYYIAVMIILFSGKLNGLVLISFFYYSPWEWIKSILAATAVLKWLLTDMASPWNANSHNFHTARNTNPT